MGIMTGCLISRGGRSTMAITEYTSDNNKSKILSLTFDKKKILTGIGRTYVTKKNKVAGKDRIQLRHCDIVLHISVFTL